MGATSATGVGKGAAGVTRGPGNNRNQFSSLLDPHIVFHGTATNDGGNVQIDLPSSVYDVPEKLTLICSTQAFLAEKLLNGDNICTGFRVYTYKKADLDYVIIKSPSGKFTPLDDVSTNDD
jgi:hypothetical protein